MKENREGVVCDLERKTEIRDYVSYVNIVMDCNGEDSSEFGKGKLNFWKFTRICCFLNKLTLWACFQHLLY